MQNDSKAGTVVVPPTANAKKSVNDVTVMATPEFFIVLANLGPISSRVLLLKIWCIIYRLVVRYLRKKSGNLSLNLSPILLNIIYGWPP